VKGHRHVRAPSWRRERGRTCPAGRVTDMCASPVPLAGKGEERAEGDGRLVHETKARRSAAGRVRKTGHDRCGRSGPWTWTRWSCACSAA
jgi:hypothetical protein